MAKYAAKDKSQRVIYHDNTGKEHVLDFSKDLEVTDASDLAALRPLLESGAVHEVKGGKA